MAREPQRFGKYLLLERISVGGMAEVFKAKAFGVEGFEKILAIKRILPSMVEDSDFIEMFIDEAKIAGQLNHANICQIYELGRYDKAHYIAMEYIAGKDLLQIMTRFERRGERIPVPVAAYIISKLCEGLDYAHRKRDHTGRPLNIVHRDVSPQNVLVSYDGEVKLIDFGIAKARYRSAKTAAGVLKGKFGYMSPEQVRGLRLDRRSDIFSLGTLLYEMVTGTRLFGGETDFAVLEKVRNGEVIPPRQINPDLSPEFEAVLLKALSLTPEGRYDWASEFQEALAKVVLRRSPPLSPKRLAAWMGEHFAEDIRRERADNERYLQLGPDGQEVRAHPTAPDLPAFDAFDEDDEETALMKGQPGGAGESDFNDIETMAQTPSARKAGSGGRVPMAEILDDDDEPPGEDATVILWSEEEDEEAPEGATMILPDDGVGLPAGARALLHPDEEPPPEGATVILPDDEAPPEGATMILPEGDEGATMILPDGEEGGAGLSLEQVRRDAAAANAAAAQQGGAPTTPAAAQPVLLPGDLPPPRPDDDPFGLRLAGSGAAQVGASAPGGDGRTADTAKTAKPSRAAAGVRPPLVAVIALAAAVVAGGITFVLRGGDRSAAGPRAAAPEVGVVVVAVQPPVRASARLGSGEPVSGKVPGLVVLEGLPRGTHEVRVEAPGYLPEVLSVTVTPGAIQAVGPARLRPRKKPSTLRVRLSELFLDAEVRLDGRVLAPAELRKPIPLPIDRTVEFRVSTLGYRDHVERIRTGHGREIVTKPIALEPDPLGQVAVRSEPPGAKVWVNGTLQSCVTPCRVTGLDPKKRFRVRVALAGYREHKGVYRFPKDESTRTVSVTLSRLSAAAGGAAGRRRALAAAPPR